MRADVHFAKRMWMVGITVIGGDHEAAGTAGEISRLELA
jgi:hypothetical protein